MKKLSQFLACAENAVHFVDIFDAVPFSFNCTKHNLLKSTKGNPHLAELKQSNNFLSITFKNGSQVAVKNRGVSGIFPFASRMVDFHANLGKNRLESFEGMPVMYETLGLMKDKINRVSKIPMVQSLSEALTHPHINISPSKISPQTTEQIKNQDDGEWGLKQA